MKHNLSYCQSTSIQQRQLYTNWESWNNFPQLCVYVSYTKRPNEMISRSCVPLECQSSVGRKTESESWKHRYPNCQENCYINSNKPVMLWGFIFCGQIPKILVVKLLQQSTYYGIKNCCIMNLGEKTEETKGVLAHIAWTLTDTGHIW